MSTPPRSADLHPGPGFRIRRHRPGVDPATLAALSRFASTDASDLLNRLFAVSPAIRRLSGEGTLCAAACTVKVFPGDNLMVHKALDLANPGEVVVVDAAGSRSNAVLGDLICAKAGHRGIAGFVVDGLVRDLPGIRELGLPVFALGTTPIGPLHRGPGEINFPISCGGVVTNPGDVILADDAGIVVVPWGIADALAARLAGDAARASGYLAQVRAGTFSNAWVDELIAALGCEVADTAGVPGPELT